VNDVLDGVENCTYFFAPNFRSNVITRVTNSATFVSVFWNDTFR